MNNGQNSEELTQSKTPDDEHSNDKATTPQATSQQQQHKDQVKE